MMISAWHLWVVIAILLFIAEVFVPGFVFICIGLGCLVSALAAGLDFGLKAQLLGLCAGVLVAFFTVRPVFMRHAYRASPQVRTNVDALVGKAGVVTERIDPSSGLGRALVHGDDWKAVSLDEQPLEKGTRIQVVKVEGTKVFVRSFMTSQGEV
jgi:membrane protein implicated in regulation of membrane protease activity